MNAKQRLTGNPWKWSNGDVIAQLMLRTRQMSHQTRILPCTHSDHCEVLDLEQCTSVLLARLAGVDIPDLLEKKIRCAAHKLEPHQSYRFNTNPCITADQTFTVSHLLYEPDAPRWFVVLREDISSRHHSSDAGFPRYPLDKLRVVDPPPSEASAQT